MRLNDKLMTGIRWGLGLQMLLSGFNWWIKMFPFPNKFDPPGGFMKAEIVQSMIETGWMFDLAKIIEVATGFSLVFNLFVPLALVASIAVTISTFWLDVAFNGETIFAFFRGEASLAAMWRVLLDIIFWGGAVLLMQGFLMLGYLHYYLPMLVPKGLHANGDPVNYAVLQPGIIERHPRARRAFTMFGIVSFVIGWISTLWLVLMINQWALPWTTLRALVVGLI
jgi:hypothetical protein